MTALDYGRVPHDALLCTTFPVELILHGIKYVMTVRTTGEHDFAVLLNGCVVNTRTHPLSDGRLLVFADGKTSTVFFEEDPTGLRLEISNKGITTVMFENEKDPSKLRATTTGKRLFKGILNHSLCYLKRSGIRAALVLCLRTSRVPASVAPQQQAS